MSRAAQDGSRHLWKRRLNHAESECENLEDSAETRHQIELRKTNLCLFMKYWLFYRDPGILIMACYNPLYSLGLFHGSFEDHGVLVPTSNNFEENKPTMNEVSSPCSKL